MCENKEEIQQWHKRGICLYIESLAVLEEIIG